MRVFQFSLHFRQWAMLALLFLFVGCGGGGGTTGVPATPGVATAPSQETATIEIRSILQRAVPSEVDQIRLTGFDSGGAVRYGPSLKAKAALLTFTQVPTSVRRVQVEYLVKQRVLGVALADVILSPGSVTALSDLEFSTIEARLEGLSIEPASLSLARGTSGRLRAVGRYDDGSVLDLSGSVDWQNSGESCEIDTTGGVEAHEIGQDRIVASFGSFSAAAFVIVTDAVIQELRLEPADATVPLGVQQGFALTGLFSDGTTQDLTSQANFTLSPPEVASTQTLSGHFRGERVGTTVISAGYGQLSTRGTLTVTEAALTGLTVTPDVSSLVKGGSLQLAARGTYTDDSVADLSSAVRWTNSSSEVCDVTPEGKVRGLSEGTARITATLGTFSSESVISVGPAVVTSLSIEPSTFSLTVGEQRVLAVTAQFSDLSSLDVTNDAVYTSGSPEIAGVSTLDPRGVVTGVAPGDSLITAVFGGQSAETSVEVKARPVGDLVITIPLVQARAVDGVITTFRVTLTPSAGSAETRTYPRSDSEQVQELKWTGISPGFYLLGLEMLGDQGTVRGTFEQGISIVTGQTTYVENPHWQDTTLEPPPAEHPEDLKSISAASIPGTPRNLVYDKTRDRVYISNSTNNTIAVYDVATKKVLEPIPVGPAPWGLDLTLDDSKLVVALSGTNQVATVDLTANPITFVTATVPTVGNNRPRNIAVAANGRALFGCIFPGSGWTDLHELNLANNTITNRNRSVRDPLYLGASGDRKKILLAEGNIGSGPIFLYDSQTRTFGASVNTSGFMGRANANQDATLFAATSGIFNSRLERVNTTTTTGGGFCFSSRPGIAYRASASLQILDTNRNVVLETIALPSNVTGSIVGDRTGRRVFAISNQSILDIDLGNRPPQLPPLATMIVPTGRSASIVLQPVDPDLDSVSVTAVQLPNGASFDADTKRLTYAPTSPTYTEVTATFRLSDGTTSRTTTLKLEAAQQFSPLVFLPTGGNLSGLTLDDESGTLFASNNTLNQIDRLSANLALDEPLPSSDGPRGLDLTPAGDRLIVCCSRSQFIDTFNLLTLERRQSLHPGLTNYAADVGVAADGTALVTSGFRGSNSGMIVRQFDIDTGVITYRQDIPRVENPSSLSVSRDRTAIGIESWTDPALIYESATSAFRSLPVPGRVDRLELNSDASLAALLPGPQIIDGISGALVTTAEGYERFAFVGATRALAHSGTNSLDLLRLNDLMLNNRYLLPQKANGAMRVSADGKQAYVACEGGIAVIDL